jgi:hypothetical protein
MDLCQHTMVSELVTCVSRDCGRYSRFELNFLSPEMNLYNWHQALGPYLGDVVRAYDRMRNTHFIIGRITHPHIIIPGEDAHVSDWEAIRHDVHRTLDWLAPEYKYQLAHSFFEDLAARLKDSNRALAQHTLLMCFGLIPVPG